MFFQVFDYLPHADGARCRAEAAAARPLGVVRLLAGAGTGRKSGSSFHLIFFLPLCVP